MNFVVVPKGGVFHFTPTQKAIFRRFLKDHDGRKITLSLDAKLPKRTLAQNNYLWGAYYPILAGDLGYTPHELHTLFKGMFLSEGVKEVMGKKVRVSKSTTELTKSEFSEFIMEIEAYTEIPAPPTEDYGLPVLRSE